MTRNVPQDLAERIVAATKDIGETTLRLNVQDDIARILMHDRTRLVVSDRDPESAIAQLEKFGYDFLPDAVHIAHELATN